MGWLDTAKKFMKDRQADIAKLMGAKTIDGVGAALALEGMANGQIKSEEEQAIMTEISSSDALSQWSVDIIAAFEKHVAKLKIGTLTAKMEVNNAIKGIPSGSLAAQVTVATCIAIGGSDGEFDEEEKKVVKNIAKMLNVTEYLDQFADLFNA